jgi:predicted transcriptional regulator
LPEFEVEPLLDLADQLQRPSKAVFEAAITDYARGEFNRD